MPEKASFNVVHIANDLWHYVHVQNNVYDVLIGDSFIVIFIVIENITVMW